MNKWLMLVVLVLVVLTAAIGFENLTTSSWNGAITVTTPSSFTMAPTTAPPPPNSW